MTAAGTRAKLTGPTLVAVIAALNFLEHALTAFRYGPEADEMYYLASSHHLAAGFEDMPPGIAVMMWIVRHTTGTSLLGMRVWAALMAAAVSLLCGAIARQLGGRRWAQAVAALVPAIAPLIVIWQHILTMNVVEHFLWAAIAYGIVRLINTQDGRWWLAIGALVGFSFEFKYTIAFLLLGLFAGLAVTPERRWLATRWFWAGAAVALAIFLPNLAWLVTHHFPFLHHMHDLRINTGLGHGPVKWLIVQIVLLHPLLAPIWAGGAIWCFTPSGARYRLLGCMFVVSVAAIMLTHGRNYYPLPAYGMIFGVGTVAWQQWLEPTGRQARAIRMAYVCLLVIVTIPLAPVFLPLLSGPSYLAYLNRLGSRLPAGVSASPGEKIAIYFQDEFGWQQLTQQVADIYHALPESERAQTAIWGADYSDAAALDYYGPRYGLPAVVSGDVAYWYWGLHGQTAQQAILTGANEEQARQRWRNVRKVGRVDSVLPREHYDILLCSDPLRPFSQVWPQMQIW